MEVNGAIKNRERVVASALLGRHLMGAHNNQLIFGLDGKRDIGEGDWDECMWGGGVSLCWAAN
jgi:hypothetical protein